MWLKNRHVSGAAICAYRAALLKSRPSHLVIDHLFDETKLDQVLSVLQQPYHWQTQRHTYSALYVDSAQWQKASGDQRFVERDVWRTDATEYTNTDADIARDFLCFLRGEVFMSFLSRIFKVQLTDINVADPKINTNYFRLGATDFVRQHADDSPGREVCMLLYLNKRWNEKAGGELVFMGDGDKPILIPPLFNRCVLFDPFSKGSEHWVEPLNPGYGNNYRYNVTSWYWSE